MGFIRTQVNFPENEPEQDVCFRVLEGSLEIPVSVQVTARDGTATCESLVNCHAIASLDVSVILECLLHDAHVRIQSNFGWS